MASSNTTQSFQQTRHARRIYVGGFPPNYADEEALKYFLNSVISKGLGEQNEDTAHVLSIYVNTKKCFAFVELRSIELATACLHLDGIIYKKVVLKVLRANEFKPELIPLSMIGASINLDLSSFSFGVPAAFPGKQFNGNNSEDPPDLVSNSNLSGIRLDSIIQFSMLSGVEHGCLTIIGYPFHNKLNYVNNNGSHSPNNRTSGKNSPIFSGSTSTPLSSNNHNTSNQLLSIIDGGSTVGYDNSPKMMRYLIRKHKFGTVHNPEYEIDLHKLKLIDIGDVLGGRSSEVAQINLATTVKEVNKRGGISFMISGSFSDCAYFGTQGIVSATTTTTIGLQEEAAATGSNIDCTTNTSPITNNNATPLFLIGHVVISAQLGEPKLLLGQQHHQQQDATSSDESTQEASRCRYIVFGAQGSQCSVVGANYITERGGRIIWLSKDIRGGATTTTNAVSSIGGLSIVHSHTMALFHDALCSAAATNSSYEQPSKQQQPTPRVGENSSQKQQQQLYTNSSTTSTTTSMEDNIPVIVTLDMSVMCRGGGGSSGGSHNSSGVIGLTADELLEIAMIAGANPNVTLFNVCEYCPETEDVSNTNTSSSSGTGGNNNNISSNRSSSNMILPELFYRFAMGVASRTTTTTPVIPTTTTTTVIPTTTTTEVDALPATEQVKDLTDNINDHATAAATNSTACGSLYPNNTTSFAAYTSKCFSNYNNCSQYQFDRSLLAISPATVSTTLQSSSSSPPPPLESITTTGESTSTGPTNTSISPTTTNSISPTTITSPSTTTTNTTAAAAAAISPEKLTRPAPLAIVNPLQLQQQQQQHLYPNHSNNSSNAKANSYFSGNTTASSSPPLCNSSSAFTATTNSARNTSAAGSTTIETSLYNSSSVMNGRNESDTAAASTSNKNAGVAAGGGGGPPIGQSGSNLHNLLHNLPYTPLQSQHRHINNNNNHGTNTIPMSPHSRDRKAAAAATQQQQRLMGGHSNSNNSISNYNSSSNNGTPTSRGGTVTNVYHHHYQGSTPVTTNNNFSRHGSSAPQQSNFILPLPYSTSSPAELFSSSSAPSAPGIRNSSYNYNKGMENSAVSAIGINPLSLATAADQFYLADDSHHHHAIGRGISSSSSDSSSNSSTSQGYNNASIDLDSILLGSSKSGGVGSSNSNTNVWREGDMFTRPQQQQQQQRPHQANYGNSSSNRNSFTSSSSSSASSSNAGQINNSAAVYEQVNRANQQQATQLFNSQFQQRSNQQQQQQQYQSVYFNKSIARQQPSPQLESNNTTTDYISNSLHQHLKRSNSGLSNIGFLELEDPQHFHTAGSSSYVNGNISSLGSSHHSIASALLMPGGGGNDNSNNLATDSSAGGSSSSSNTNKGSRSYSNLSTMSNSDVHPYDESMDLFEANLQLQQQKQQQQPIQHQLPQPYNNNSNHYSNQHRNTYSGDQQQQQQQQQHYLSPTSYHPLLSQSMMEQHHHILQQQQAARLSPPNAEQRLHTDDTRNNSINYGNYSQQQQQQLHQTTSVQPRDAAVMSNVGGGSSSLFGFGPSGLLPAASKQW